MKARIGGSLREAQARTGGGRVIPRVWHQGSWRPPYYVLRALATGASTAALRAERLPLGAAVFWSITREATSPGDAAVKSGTGAAAFGSSLSMPYLVVEPGAAGLSPGTQYHAHFVVELDGRVIARGGEAFRTSEAAIGTPALHDPIVEPAGVKQLAASVRTSVDGGTLYVSATRASIPLSSADIKNGVGAFAIAQAAGPAGRVSVTGNLTGLEEEPHYVQFLLRSPAGVDSPVLVRGPVTPGDVTAPRVSSAEALVLGAVDFTWGVNSDHGSGTAHGVFTNSPTVPSAARIIAGQDHTGAPAVRAVSAAVNEWGRAEGAGTGLPDGRVLHFHATAKDDYNNIAAPIYGHTIQTQSTSDPVPFLSGNQSRIWYVARGPHASTHYEDRNAATLRVGSGPVGAAQDKITGKWWRAQATTSDSRPTVVAGAHLAVHHDGTWAADQSMTIRPGIHIAVAGRFEANHAAAGRRFFSLEHNLLYQLNFSVLTNTGALTFTWRDNGLFYNAQLGNVTNQTFFAIGSLLPDRLIARRDGGAPVEAACAWPRDASTSSGYKHLAARPQLNPAARGDRIAVLIFDRPGALTATEVGQIDAQLQEILNQ